MASKRETHLFLPNLELGQDCLGRTSRKGKERLEGLEGKEGLCSCPACLEGPHC